MRKNICPHCLPTKRHTHLDLHVDFYIQKIIKILFYPSFLIGKYINSNSFWTKIFEFLAKIKLVSFENNITESSYANRSLIFFKEARERGVQISVVKAFGKYKDEFRFIHKEKIYSYTSIPITIFPNKIDFDNKGTTKKLFIKNNVPTPQGDVFTNKKKALSRTEQLQFPLVVKPNSGSLSHHLTCPVNNLNELDKAIELAREYQPEFIVEEFIPGRLYRASVIGQKHVFICEKELANVIGNGINTIEELITIKNSDSKRGNPDQKNYTLHKISVDKCLEEMLRKQNLTLMSVPAETKKIILQKKFILAHGCDIINKTAICHEQNKKLFIDIAKLLRTDLVGIDFICPDIAIPHTDQRSAVIEVNGLPYIDMHQFPSHGESEPVARLAWDFILQKLDTK